MTIKTDKNGLELSGHSDSGYKFVTTFLAGPLAGKFIAFADVKAGDLQELNQQYAGNIKGFFGFKNVVGLGVFDSVLDAAYVGQQFYGTCSDDRDDNLAELFAGNDSVVAEPDQQWDHEPDFDSMERGTKRAKYRAANPRAKKLSIQEAIVKFNKEHVGEYNVSIKEAPAIRKAMDIALRQVIGRVSNMDLLEAAEAAFAPFKK